MNVETKTKFIVICSLCLACLILCGCYEEQSNNKRRYSVSTQRIIDAANGPREINDQQEAIERYDPVVNDALYYVHKHSTERMKRYISRGKLVVGMNQKEVIACLHATNFRDGVPVTSKTYNSKYGKYETWIIGASSGGKDSSYSPPKYAIDFTYYILTCIHEP